MRSLLIVNADDFGISEGVNRGIVEAHLNGILTSTTVMANMPAFEQAAQLRRDHPTLATGVHLNLTAGRPILPPHQLQSLVDREGRFLGGSRLLLGLTVGRIDLRHAEAELSAQLERAIWAGFSPDHLDSHHHLHCHPMLQPIVVRLAQRYGIRAIRCPVELGVIRNGPHPDPLPGGEGNAEHPLPLGEAWTGQRAGPRGEGPRSPRRESPQKACLKAVVLTSLGRLLRLRARRAGLVTTDHFRGLAIGLAFSSEELAETIRRLPAGSTEMMCHPGYPDPGLEAETSYAAGRDRELAALLDPNHRRHLQMGGVTLGNYSDLSG